MKNSRHALFFIVLLINFSFILSSIDGNTLFMTLAQLEPASTIEKVSEKGYYLVQFKSGLGPTTPEIPIDIVFLNATSPTGFVEKDPVYSGPTTKEGGDTELAEDKQMSVPINYNIAPVQSYDLTIYDDQGNTLWQKVDNNLVGISGKDFVTLGNYQGNITIAVDNITLLPEVEEKILERQPSSSGERTTDKTLKDSVKFNVFVDSDRVIKADPSKTEFTIRPG
jgi:hypothetical protein